MQTASLSSGASEREGSFGRDPWWFSCAKQTWRVDDNVPRWMSPSAVQLSCTDVALQLVCRTAEEGRMAIYLWCIKCSEKGIKIWTGRNENLKDFCSFFFWSSSHLSMEPQTTQTVVPISKTDACQGRLQSAQVWAGLIL